MIVRALRMVAILIALLAWLDPAVSSSRHARPVVSLVVPDATQDAALAARVGRSLQSDVLVLPVAFGGADAAVIVGTQVPDLLERLPPALFAVTPGGAASVRIVHASSPRTVPRHARVPVKVRARVTGSGLRDVNISLQSAGAVLDRRIIRISAPDTLVEVGLSFLPARETLVPLDVEVSSGSVTARVALVTEVSDTRWPVLFFDTRPSWTSTFVRRALEQDARFSLTSRTATSRAVAMESGRPPQRLADLEVGRFSTVVIGAPDGLAPVDVAALERYLRRAGGSVVLLMDADDHGPWETLTGVREWRGVRTPRPTQVSGVRDATRLESTELVWPEQLPAGGQALARADSAGQVADRPVVWTSAVGAGRLYVSGALDAWRYRDRGPRGFRDFWQQLLAESSARVSGDVDVRVTDAVVGPGAEVNADVVIRDAILAAGAATATVTARLEPVERPGDRHLVRLWPGASQGSMVASFVAPVTPGMYRLVVESDHGQGTGVLRVAADAAVGLASGTALLPAVVASRGGVTVGGDRLDELTTAVRAAFQPVSHVDTWYPMRSAWWILPFAMLLGAEWWWRRRQGLA